MTTRYAQPQQNTVQSAFPFVRLLLTAAVAFLVLAMIAAAGFQLIYAGRILPGVAVSGYSIGGMTPDEAVRFLSIKLDYPTLGKIVFTDNDHSWTATPADLGFFLDAQSTAKAAYQYGRSGIPTAAILEQIKAWSAGSNLSPRFVYDQHASQQYLDSLAKQVDQPVVDAALSLNGMEVVTRPSQPGRTVDIDKTIRLLAVRLSTMQNGEIPLVISETAPAVVDLSSQAEAARQLLSTPLVLSLPQGQSGDAGPWAIDPENIASLLNFIRADGTGASPYQIKLNEDGLKAYLSVLAPVVDQKAANARFRFNDDTRQIDLVQSAKIGRTLDVDRSIQNIEQAATQGQHQAELAVITSEPAIKDNATAQDLGITELVHAETSYYYGSAAARIQNIKTAANSFDGLLIAPGETFSMGDALGDVSLDNGYTEGLIIVGDKTVKGIGGGVCQVSTTLFRAAFFAGFPILERHAHAYRVGYYEQRPDASSDPNLAGMDATVYEPVIDLKFKNDTPYWLLMETYPTDTALTWKFYSTSDGRTVDWKNSGPQNVVPAPAPVYKVNKELSEGTIKQVDWAAEGADFEVTRQVIRDGQAIINDSFSTHYTPWQAIYEYGPGTQLPKKAKTQ